MHSNRFRAAIVRLSCALALLLPLVAFAAAPALDDAQKLYDSGKFAEAATGLRTALGTGQVTGNDVVAARAFLARCLVKAGQRLEAKQTFKTVLRLDPAWRPDAVMVPPDEMDVFNLALKEVQAEQIEAGQRVPASIALFYGVGAGDNKDFAKLVEDGGGKDKFDSKAEFGGSVRFPIKPRWSLDIELLRLRATDRDSFVTFPRFTFESTGIPLVVSLYRTTLTGPKHRLNLFVGGGPMMAARAAIKFNTPGTGYFVADERVGSYYHLGAEGEFLVSQRIAVNGRVLYRSATAKNLFKDSQLGALYGGSGNATELKNQKIDFSGVGAFIGLRAYIGY